jgi:alanyl-tRNA synthetase
LIFDSLASPHGAQLASISYASADETTKTRLKVVGDHTRAVVYLISDGVLPSNIGRGYIVRRLVRRVVRNGRLLGVPSGEAFTPKVAAVAVALSGECDVAVGKNAARIYAELEREEMRFVTTLEKGEALLAEMLGHAAQTKVLPGGQAFMLYDTYGFPLEITEEVAAEHGITVDIAGFNEAMATQRAQSQAAAVSVDVTADSVLAQVRVCRPFVAAAIRSSDTITQRRQVADAVGETAFMGYTTLLSHSRVVALLVDGKPVSSAAPGQTVDLVLDSSPFYAESGGQVGDRGILETAEGAQVRVTDVQKAGGGRLFVHRGQVNGGHAIKVDTDVKSSVDATLRRRVRKKQTPGCLHCLTLTPHRCCRHDAITPQRICSNPP